MAAWLRPLFARLVVLMAFNLWTQFAVPAAAVVAVLVALLVVVLSGETD